MCICKHFLLAPQLDSTKYDRQANVSRLRSVKKSMAKLGSHTHTLALAWESFAANLDSGKVTAFASHNSVDNSPKLRAATFTLVWTKN